MAKLSIRTFKKSLESKTKQELINELATLVKKFKQVEEYYYSHQSSTNLKDVLKHYKEIIEKEFIEGKTRGMPKARLSVARKALNDYKKIDQTPENVLELKLCYVASLSWFSSEFEPRKEEYYTIPENMFEEVLNEAKKLGIEEKFKETAQEIVANASEGYGHHDSLMDRYTEVYGEFDY